MDVRLSENLAELNPALLQSLFEEDHEQEVVLLHAVLQQCLFVFSVFVLSPDLILQSCCPVFCPSGFRAASQSRHRRVSFTLFLLHINL